MASTIKEAWHTGIFRVLQLLQTIYPKFQQCSPTLISINLQFGMDLDQIGAVSLQRNHSYSSTLPFFENTLSMNKTFHLCYLRLILNTPLKTKCSWSSSSAMISSPGSRASRSVRVPSTHYLKSGKPNHPEWADTRSILETLSTIAFKSSLRVSRSAKARYSGVDVKVRQLQFYWTSFVDLISETVIVFFSLRDCSVGHTRSEREVA